MAKVLNKRKDKIPDDAIYVGRPSKWGNPFEMDKPPHYNTRQQVITLYEAWFHEISGLWIGELVGKDLVCWCAPKPCHADVLLRLAEEFENSKRAL